MKCSDQRDAILVSPFGPFLHTEAAAAFSDQSWHGFSFSDTVIYYDLTFHEICSWFSICSIAFLGIFFTAVILIPTWSRVRHQGEGQRPLRSRAHPSGSQTCLAPAEIKSLRQATLLNHRMVSYLALKRPRGKLSSFLMMPEDSGGHRVSGPASLGIWKICETSMGSLRRCEERLSHVASHPLTRSTRLVFSQNVLPSVETFTWAGPNFLVLVASWLTMDSFLRLSMYSFTCSSEGDVRVYFQFCNLAKFSCGFWAHILCAIGEVSDLRDQGVELTSGPSSSSSTFAGLFKLFLSVEFYGCLAAIVSGQIFSLAVTFAFVAPAFVCRRPVLSCTPDGPLSVLPPSFGIRWQANSLSSSRCSQLQLMAPSSFAPVFLLGFDLTALAFWSKFEKAPGLV